MIRKIIKLKEEDVVDGMIEDTKSNINRTFYTAINSISALYMAMLIFAMFLIVAPLYKLFAVLLLSAVYVFSILSLKSYTMIQLEMLKNIINIKNPEDNKNGTTKYD